MVSVSFSLAVLRPIHLAAVIALLAAGFGVLVILEANGVAVDAPLVGSVNSVIGGIDSDVGTVGHSVTLSLLPDYCDS